MYSSECTYISVDSYNRFYHVRFRRPNKKIFLIKRKRNKKQKNKKELEIKKKKKTKMGNYKIKVIRKYTQTNTTARSVINISSTPLKIINLFSLHSVTSLKTCIINCRRYVSHFYETKDFSQVGGCLDK